MKRFLPYILIFSVVLQFFAPFTVDIKNKDIPGNIARAETTENRVENDDDPAISIKLNILPKVTNKTITLEVKIDEASKVADSFVGEAQAMTLNFYIEVNAYELGGEKKVSDGKSGILSSKKLNEPFTIEMSGFEAQKEYKLVIDLFKRLDEPSKGIMGKGIPIRVHSQTLTIPTGKTSDTETLNDLSVNTTYESNGVGKRDNLPVCGVFNIGGCIARVIYYLFYMPTSFLFGLAGTAMDYTLMYSLSDGSYRTPFVSEGWKIVRDLCNMFFIFILLYIAFTTILDSGGSKNKNTVINVVIIGLVINFSLFATHVIIDASNILARVFYNPKIVDIEKVENGQNVKVGLDEDYKYIKISETIVSMVNPQKLLSQETQDITKGSNQKKEAVSKGEEDGISTGSFILVTIMASIVNIMGMMAFLSIALSFIGRVVGLWLAMVLSPIAFLTFTIPQLKNVQYIGWTKWWPDTLKTAFMAPIFVFFLYIILMFLESNLGIAKSAQSSEVTGLNYVLSIIIPFVLILVLLKQAQKIATNMAGEIAGFITEKIGKPAASFVGGAALGALTGGGAMLMRGTVGKLGAGLMNSEKLKLAESKGGISGMMAKQLRNVGDFTSKKSFDVRNTSLGKAAGKELGADLGKGKTGGYVKAVEEKQKKKEERAKTLELGKNSQEAKTLRETEERLEATKESILSPELEEKTKKEIEEAKEEFKDAQAKYLADNTEENKKAMEQAESKYKQKKDAMKNIKEGGEKEDGNFYTDNGNITESEYNKRKDAADKADNIEANTIAEASKKEQEAIKKAGEDYTKTENEEKEKFTAARIAAGEKKRAAQEKAAREYDEAMIKYSQVQTAFRGSTNPEDQQLIIDAKNKMDAAKNKMGTIKSQSEEKEREEIRKAEEDKRSNTNKASIIRIKAESSAQDEKAQAEEEAKKKSAETKKLFEKANERSNNGNTFGKSIKELSTEVRDKKQDIDNKNRQRKVQYAGTVRRETIFDSISTGGQYRSNDADIAAHNIIMSTRQRN
ncbi:MAG: hypothetical protein EOM85_03685 [Candidatus Moranbacteria bacterium]|nr:hypothetical protein [Candidatus Moranbacteria bacterium]